MMNFKSIVSIFLTTLFSLATAMNPFFIDTVYASNTLASKVNDTKHWKKDRVIRGYTVFTSNKANSGIVPIKIEGVVNAPITDILENLRTIEGSEDWTPDLMSKTTLKDFGASKAITYSLTNMPWPISNRTLILENELFIDKHRMLLFVVSKSVDFDEVEVPRPEGTIEAFVGYSSMGFRPLSKSKTFIEFTAWVDPKGSIPDWVINFFQKKWPIKFFEALEERCHNHNSQLRPGLKLMLGDLLKEMKWDSKTFE